MLLVVGHGDTANVIRQWECAVAAVATVAAIASFRRFVNVALRTVVI
jgi:hypothetical protein